MLINDFEERLQEVRKLLYIDENDFLREKCADTEKLYAAISLGDSLLLQATTKEDLKYKTYQRIAYLNRLAGCYATSLMYLKEALNYFEKKGGREYIITLLNYGETLKHTKAYDKALNLFQELLTYCNKHQYQQFEDIIWQFKGKCYLEQGAIIKAEHCFYKAYVIRKMRGERALLNQSEKALTYIGKMKR